ncbi:MAG: dihydrolipoyl dehydrogenase [Desulfobulbaceae bacterium]|nr:dihydrolipoyl dehydrogenase [Desulfobulbaceae bacterium]
MARKVDVAIIGAGSSGLSALSEVQKKTDDYVIINAGHYGTSCARVACMPSKVLIEAANCCHSRKLLVELGVEGVDKLRINRKKILARVMTMRDGFVKGTKQATDKLGERNIAGRARFRDPQTLEVNGEVITARRIIIATGSSPVYPQSWKAFADRILTTEDLFYQDDLPDSMGVIGLGAAGLELAQALNRIGIQVTGYDEMERIGGLSDPEVNESAVKVISGEMTLRLGARAELSAAGDKVKIIHGSGETNVDKVLLAMGRRPNITDLGLENLGVELDEHGLPPFNPESLQIAGLPVFITGDANNFRPLLHEAIDEGHIAGYNAVCDDVACFRRRVPLAITFCEPNIVLVGKRYAELDQKTTVIGSYDFNKQSRARMSNSNHGLLRLYADKSKGTLLGAEMAAPAGEHLGHLLALALHRQISVFELLTLPYYHPVIEEGFRTAVRAAAQQVEKKLRESELLLCESVPPDCLS